MIIKQITRPPLSVICLSDSRIFCCRTVRHKKNLIWPNLTELAFFIHGEVSQGEKSMHGIKFESGTIRYNVGDLWCWDSNKATFQIRFHSYRIFVYTIGLINSMKLCEIVTYLIFILTVNASTNMRYLCYLFIIYDINNIEATRRLQTWILLQVSWLGNCLLTTSTNILAAWHVWHPVASSASRVDFFGFLGEKTDPTSLHDFRYISLSQLFGRHCLKKTSQ